MTDFTKKTPYPVLALTVFLTLCTVVMRTVMLLYHYDATIGHFDTGALADLIFPLTCVLGCVIYAFYAFLLRGVSPSTVKPLAVPELFSSAFAIVGVGVFAFSFLFMLLPKASSIALTLLGFLLFFCAIGTAAFFLARILHTASESITIAFCFSAVLFCAFVALYTYFYDTFVMGSPIKIFNKLTFVSLSFFFLFEARALLGKPRFALHLPMSLFSMLFTATASLPNLVYAAVKGSAVSGTVTTDFLFFSLFLYATARAVSLLLALHDSREKPKEASVSLPDGDLPLPDDTTDYEISAEDLIRLSESDGSYDAGGQPTVEFDPTVH